MNFFSSSSEKNNNDQIIDAIRDGAILVDVRTPAEFAEGSAKGAINIPLDRVEQQLEQFRGHKNIIVFCRSGARSNEAKSILEENNFENVFNGGSWQNVNQLLNNK